jgi:polyhydroxybutyrate depolymerase
MPLVLNFPGLTESPHWQELLTGMNEAAGRRGMMVVYPEGIGWSWNAGTCCGRAFYEHVDDVRFVRELVDHLEREYCIDRNRVYSTGMSNGGLLSYRLACEASDLFAAIAPVAAVEAVDACQPSRPVPVLAFHGGLDVVVPYHGGVWKFPSVEETVARWRQRDGCNTASWQSIFENGHAHCEAAQSCRDGSDVVLCTAERSGHTWPGGAFVPWLGGTSGDVNATETILDFFAAHPKR